MTKSKQNFNSRVMGSNPTNVKVNQIIVNSRVTRVTTIKVLGPDFRFLNFVFHENDQVKAQL